MIAASYFDAGAEGWTLTEWSGPGSTVAAGSQTGGCIAAADTYSDGFFNAPAVFLVNRV